MRKVIQIAADGNILYALSDDWKVFSKHIGKAEWEAVLDLPQDENNYDYSRDIESLVESGTKAWADVPSATEFVEDLRGNDFHLSFASAIGIGQNPDPYQSHEVNSAIKVLAEKLLSVGIKEDMPVFVLKPTDKYVLGVIGEWIDAYPNINSDKYSSANQKFNEFHDWQQANPSRVKEPD